MDLLNIFSFFLIFNFHPCRSLEENKTKVVDITTNCFEPLGISDGRIQDYQLDASSTYDNEFKTYGPQRARLNMTSWPPGFRSAPDKADSAWFKVEIGQIIVITGIATQGYGDTSVSEWLSSYILLYSKGDDDHFSYFMDTNGELQIFTGNYDSNSTQVNRVILPAKAVSVMLMPFLVHNNFAFRMELYGCRPDYYFVAWLMLAKTRFTVDSLDQDQLHTIVDDVHQQVTSLLKATPGFLDIRVKRFSPQESEKDGASLTAEVEIECLRYSQTNVVSRLQEEITSGSTIFNSKYLQIQYTADEVNLLVNVSLNLTKNLQGIMEILPDESCRFEANVSLPSGAVNSSLEKYKFRWEVSTIYEDTGQFSPIVELLDKDRNITISSGYMPVGLTFVRVSVIPKETSGPVNYDFGFIRILPRLKITIYGPEIVIKGGGTVQLNSVMEGVLTELLGKKAESVTYLWSCAVDNSVSSNMTIKNSTQNTSSGMQINTTKCFQPDVLKSAREQNLVFNPDLLISNRTYIFHVMASQGRRIVTAAHKLRVDTNISLSIKCVTNCENRVSTRRKLVLKTQCTGISCSVLSVYNWSLYVRLDVVSHESWSKIDHLDHIALTSLDGPNLVIGGEGTSKNHSSLLSKKTYKVRVIAWIDNENFQSDSYIFHTNQPPSKQGNNSGCFVDPKQGEAITTEFSVKCVNWTDIDLPFSYQFSYQTKFGVVVFHSGGHSNVTTDFPVGKPSRNYSLVLQLEVVDALGDSAVEVITVQVRPPKAPSIKDSKGKLDNLLDSGNVEKAMQMAFAVLSTAEGTSDEQTNSFKNSLIDKMTDVEVGSMQQATLVVGVIAMATESEEGISDDSEEKALNMLGNAANFISSQMSNGTADPDLVRSIGTSLFSGIGNVLTAASSKAGLDNEEADEGKEADELKADSEAAKEKSKQRAKNAVNLVSKVGDSLLATKAVGEKPTVFKTKSLDVLLDRQRASDMGGKKLGEGPSGVALPSATSLFSGLEGEGTPEAVDSQMLSFNKNPFTWDKSAETVKSSVLDFKLKTSGGKTMNISGLQEPIELFIPISAKADEPAKSNGSEPKLFLKPSNGTSNIRFHMFSVSSPDVLVTITIKPERGKKVDVFVNYKTKPTPQENVFSKTIPDLSSCTGTTANSSENHNCSSNPYTFTFSSLVSGHTGFHFLGVRYVMENTEADAKAGPERTRRSCNPSHGRGKRSCVDVKDAPTTPAPTPRIIVPTYNSSTDVNYTLSISVSGCLYWSESKEKWTGEGCRVGPKTTSKHLQCLCTHLSAFGGDFFVAPNPIDFDKVFAAFGNLAESGNFVVLSTVCVILGLYAIGLVFARREDKNDELRVVANVNINEDEGDSKYYISIQTGMWRGNGTSANVGLAIYGSDGNTGDISLTDPQLDKVFFSRGSINNFTLCLQEPLGSLEKIRIWHDSSGRNPSWFLMQVVIQDLNEGGEKTHFVANRWIAVEKEDGKLELELSVAGKKELSGFKNLFYSRTATSLGEKHLWLSVLTRPPHNLFTRAQRLACCLSILFAAMVTNAMFYNFGTPSGDTMQVGPLKVSLTQIKIGIQSSIVAIPVNVLVVSIFRNLKPRSTPEDQETKPQGCLPHWFVFVAWFICIMATLTSAAFIVFYSMMWGAETSNEWLVSVMVSFFQDVIVMQPVKVLIVASVLSVLIKKPPEQEKVIGESVSGSQGSDVVPPDAKERERARKFRSSLVKVGRKVLEFVLFGIFILLMMVVCYSNRGVERFMVTQSMEDLFQSFSNINNIPSFWKWSKNVLVPRLYNVDWYNGRPFEYEEGFLSNRAAFLVGMPRLRQLRVKTGKNCSIKPSAPALATKFSRCLPLYGAEVEYMSQYNRPGWYPVQNATEFYNDFELEKECPRPWRYRTAENLNLRPFEGVMATFVGGGFIADLGYNSRSALKVIKVLENEEWIDDRTVAVFVEFTIFEPSSSLFSSIKLLFERSPTGGSLATVMFKTLSLYASPDPNYRSLFQVCQLLLMIMIIVFIFAEIGKLHREKCSYFKQLWNWLELLQLCSTICALVFFFLKESKTSQFVKTLQENPFKTSSIDNIEFMSDLETYLLSFVIFIVTVKFLRLIKFNRHVCQVLGTLQRAVYKVFSFMTVFVTIILAYTQVGFLVFSTDVSAYSSFYSSLRAMLLLLFGGEMHFHELQSTSRFIAPAFLFSYLLTMFMVLLNMFLAILNDCYYEVKNVDPGEAFADAELGAFMVDYANQKLTTYVDETLKLIVGMSKSVVRFFRNEKQQENKDDLESLSGEVKLASFDSMGDIADSDDDNDDKCTEPLVKFKSLSSLDMYETMSLGDLKESIAQIGREIQQSLTSLKSATSRKSSYHQPAPYDFKKALARLEEDDGAVKFDWRSSYFSAFGSYLEDIWQKERRSIQDLSGGCRHKRRDRKYPNVRENQHLLGET